MIRRFSFGRIETGESDQLVTGACFMMIRSGDLERTIQPTTTTTTTSTSTTVSTISTTTTADLSHVALLHFEEQGEYGEFLNEWGYKDEWDQWYYVYNSQDGSPELTDAEYKFGAKSLHIPNGASIMSWDVADIFQPGTGAFTIDFWFKDDSVGHSGGLCCVGDGATSVRIEFNSSAITVQVNGSTYYTFSMTMSDGNWHHYAVTRDGSNNLRAFLDGTQCGAAQTSNENILASGRSYIGKNGQYGSNSNGYYDEFHVLTGVCAWDSSFTAPTHEYGWVAPTTTTTTSSSSTTSTTVTALPAGDGILMHFNGGDGSTTFTDESGRTWTPHGSVELDTDQKVFGTASGMFLSETSDYLSTTDADNLPDGVELFTVDFRVRFRSTVPDMVSFVQLGDGYSDNIICYLSYGSLGIVWGGCWSSFSWSPSADTWYHLAFVRNTHANGGMCVFVDGTRLGTDNWGSLDSDQPLNITGNCYIGYDAAEAMDVGVYLNGWIDELRVLKGTAAWASNFTPPVAEY